MTRNGPYWCGECGHDWPECQCGVEEHLSHEEPAPDAEHVERPEGYPKDQRTETESDQARQRRGAGHADQIPSRPPPEERLRAARVLLT